MDGIVILLMVLSVGVNMFSKGKKKVEEEEQKATRNRERGELSASNMPQSIPRPETSRNSSMFEQIAGEFDDFLNSNKGAKGIPGMAKMEQYVKETVNQLEGKADAQKKEALKRELKQKAMQRQKMGNQQQGSLAGQPLTGCYEESATLSGQMKSEGDSFYNLSDNNHAEDANYTIGTKNLNLLTDIQKSIIMAEVLGKPKALRRAQ